MARVYKRIDSDGHILEPVTLWNDYMDPKFRDRAPKLIIDNDGKEKLLLENQVLGSKQGMGGIGGVGARQGEIKAETLKYEDGRPGGFDPHKRIPDMDLDGIDAAFLYPSMGLFSGAVHDPALAGALCRAYNRWLADYCKPYPDRLFGIAMLPMQDVDTAVEEMKYARKELGMRGGFMRPNPYNDRLIHDPAYEPFWTACEEHDFVVGFHEGGSSGMPTVGIDRFEGRAAQHIISHTMEMMLACLSMIWGGVCERHPKLRVGFLESGGGWIAPWLDRMDRHFDDQGFNDSGLKTRPSEIFKKQCWISFEPVEGSLAHLADYVGADKILWATDYPHRDGFFPGAPDMIEKQLDAAGVSAATKHGVMAGGAMAFYGLN